MTGQTTIWKAGQTTIWRDREWERAVSGSVVTGAEAAQGFGAIEQLFFVGLPEDVPRSDRFAMLLSFWGGEFSASPPSQHIARRRA